MLLALGVAIGAAFTAAGPPLGSDYPGPSWVGVNAAGPSIEALARGDLAAFAAEQPMMGAFSLVLRAPFVALAGALGGELLAEYRFGAFICVLALGVLGLYLARLVAGERPWLIRILVVGLVMGGPMTFKALFWGHPEELLAAALAVAAVLLAPRRPLVAAVLLGCAVATKQWALLAVVPVVAVAAPEWRLRMLLLAGGVAAAWTAPMAIGDFDRFLDQNRAAGSPGKGVTPSSLWWVFGDVVSTQPGETGEVVENYAIPTWMIRASGPLAIAVAAALSVMFWRRRRDYGPADALTLLALLMLIRCILDPMTISYHHAPFYAALAAAEVLRTRALPVLTLGTAGVLVLVSELAAHPNLLNAVYLAWALPMVLLLVLSLLRARIAQRFALGRAMGAAGFEPATSRV
jgi:hypothetical protein